MIGSDGGGRLLSHVHNIYYYLVVLCARLACQRGQKNPRLPLPFSSPPTAGRPSVRSGILIHRFGSPDFLLYYRRRRCCCCHHYHSRSPVYDWLTFFPTPRAQSVSVWVAVSLPPALINLQPPCLLRRTHRCVKYSVLSLVYARRWVL